MDRLEELHYFSCPVYVVKKPDFLESVKKVSDRYLKIAKEKVKGNKMTLMTAGYSHEKEIADFAQYVSQTAWNILSGQGYAMEKLATYFTEMWTQEHNKYSSMETHIHGQGSQISAFYFLDVPKGGCKMVVHDPRQAKVIINLPQKDDKIITPASAHIVLTPEPGALIMTNAWLPHSFTKNGSNEPVRFVHMNLSVAVAPQQS
ncbi:Conserved hypothetical protein CHP02466 [uncultured Caudovirales phage]|uniref:Uncharacterized protein n=1 Tax=uncultured Caudovirales phage TaxID=2100421 RepID=A0A6J7WV98_9CAUD|nr:Conserved hypothetical protein CHP02466 [uncultured Caudovirales phage]